MSKKDIALSSKSVKSVELEGDRQLKVILTTPTLDRDLEIIDTNSIRVPIKPSGLKYANELTSQDEVDVPFLIDHDWSLEKQAGYVKSMWINEQGELEGVVQLASVDNGDRVYQLAKDGALGNSFSIGYSLQNATEEDGSIKNIELLEFSAVFKGANRSARLLEVKSVKGRPMTELEKKQAQLKELQSEIEADQKAADNKLREDGKKIIESYADKTKGLVSDILSADHSWETQDDKWDAMSPIHELYSALQEAWYMSLTPLEDFEELVKEFASLLESIANGTDVKSIEMSEKLSGLLDGKTVDDIAETIKPTKEAEATETEEVETAEDAEATEEAETEVEADKTNLKTEEKTMSKEIATKSIATEAAEQEVVETKKFDKIDHAAKQFVAYLNKDTKALAKLNQEALETYKGEKATYLNTGVTADGGAIVPSAQLLADVYTTLGAYSSVAADIRVITLEAGDSLDIATLIDDVVVTEVNAEGGDKDVTKPTFGEGDITLREFAGIAIITKKLVRQAAVNVYDILRNSFARAIARKRAELILTDATSGITNNAGVTTVGTASDLPTYKELTSAAWKIPVGAVSGSKFYLSREALGALADEEDAVGNSYVTLDGDAGLTGRLRNGFRFAVEESLGVNGAPHAVFGSFGRFGILLRQGTVESETFDTGIVVDGSDVEHNLLQQNKLAHRVAFYENAGFPVPAAFAVFEQATS